MPALLGRDPTGCPHTTSGSHVPRGPGLNVLMQFRSQLQSHVVRPMPAKNMPRQLRHRSVAGCVNPVLTEIAHFSNGFADFVFEQRKLSSLTITNTAKPICEMLYPHGEITFQACGRTQKRALFEHVGIDYNSQAAVTFYIIS